MIMRKTDHVDRFKCPSFFFDRDLCSFATVDQNTASVISQHQGCQPTSWKRHHTAASKQTNIKHSFSPYLIRPQAFDDCCGRNLFIISYRSERADCENSFRALQQLGRFLCAHRPPEASEHPAAAVLTQIKRQLSAVLMRKISPYFFYMEIVFPHCSVFFCLYCLSASAADYPCVKFLFFSSCLSHKFLPILRCTPAQSVFSSVSEKAFRKMYAAICQTRSDSIPDFIQKNQWEFLAGACLKKAFSNAL